MNQIRQLEYDKTEIDAMCKYYSAFSFKIINKLEPFKGNDKLIVQLRELTEKHEMVETLSSRIALM